MKTKVPRVSMRNTTALVAMVAIAMMLLALVPAMALPGASTGTVTGTVTDADTGDPIEDATVTISYHGITRTDQTDANGRYSFSNVPLCYCLKNISVSKDGYEDQSKEVGVGKLTVVDFEMEPTDDHGSLYGAITGTVTDYNNGEPLEGARVELSYHDLLRVELTDVEGKYRFDEVPECFCLKNLTVTKEHFRPESKQVAVSGETIVDFELWIEEQVPPMGTVKGTVTDTNDGRPIQGAKVVLSYHDTTWETVTDDEGKYTFTEVAECSCPKTIDVTKDGYRGETVEVVVKGVTVVDVELLFMELEPHEGIVTGTVYDATDKQPLQGVLVIIEYHDRVREFHTDAEGKYYFGQVPECRCYKNVSASVEGYLSETKAVSVLGETVVDFELEPTDGGGSNPGLGTIMGTVTDIDDGQPIEGARVELSYHGLLRTFVTGADGKYAFDDVPECFCLKNLTVTKEGYMPETEQAAVDGVTVVDFELLLMELEPHEGIVTGTVTDKADGKPLRGVHVIIKYHGTSRETFTDSGGKYTFGQVPGCYCMKEISASMDGYLTQTKEVGVSGKTVVDFALGPSGPTPDGQPEVGPNNGRVQTPEKTNGGILPNGLEGYQVAITGLVFALIGLLMIWAYIYTSRK